MQIHVVQPGQTLYGIAQAYGVRVETIATANEINPEESLVVGQALVIPIYGRYHFVQPGQSLYTIAQLYGLDVATIALLNRIAPDQPLQVGWRLYIPPRMKRDIEVNAYVEPGEEVSESLRQQVEQVAPLLTYLAPFSFQIQRDGSLSRPNLDDFPAIAQNSQVTLMMVITNLENERFSDELAGVILNNVELQNILLDNIIATAKELGFRDIHFDLEFIRPADRDAYNAFLRRARERIHQEGIFMSTALAPKVSREQTGEWYTAHDYATHGELADFVVIMTYEWGYSGGPPMPVSPIHAVRRVLEYALTEIPGDKILMGQNLYGYDWTLPYVPGGEYARALSPQAAIQLAREVGAQIMYDYEAQAPYFDYTDEEGRVHKVWFEDARSIQAKFALLRELGLRGISYWKLGLSFPQNWLLLEDNFTIVKR